MKTAIHENDTPDDLHRATAALRDAAIPRGPSPAVLSATLATLARGTSQPVPRWSIGASLLARAAVFVCLAAGAAAAYFAFARRGGNYARRPPMVPPMVTIDAGGSMITGELRLEGSAPPPRLIDFGPTGGRPDRGGQPMYDDSLLVNLDDTLRNVVVSVAAGLPESQTYLEPADPVYLDESEFSFQPHVLAMRTGQPIVLRNSDPLPHNTHSLSVRNKPFNVTEPGADAGKPIPGPTEPEIFQIRCDIHPWMKSWCCAFNHPYFDVSLANGTFTLRGLPPGRYRLRAWHERLGTLERDIVVKPGRDTTVNFIYRLPPPPNSPQAALLGSAYRTHETG